MVFRFIYRKHILVWVEAKLFNMHYDELVMFWLISLLLSVYSLLFICMNRLNLICMINTCPSSTQQHASETEKEGTNSRWRTRGRNIIHIIHHEKHPKAHHLWIFVAIIPTLYSQGYTCPSVTGPVVGSITRICTTTYENTNIIHSFDLVRH